MGHERIGFIPKTKQWQSIVAQLQDYDGDKTAVAKVAADTLDSPSPATVACLLKCVIVSVTRLGQTETCGDI